MARNQETGARRKTEFDKIFLLPAISAHSTGKQLARIFIVFGSVFFWCFGFNVYVFPTFCDMIDDLEVAAEELGIDISTAKYNQEE